MFCPEDKKKNLLPCACNPTLNASISLFPHYFLVIYLCLFLQIKCFSSLHCYNLSENLGNATNLDGLIAFGRYIKEAMSTMDKKTDRHKHTFRQTAQYSSHGPSNPLKEMHYELNWIRRLFEQRTQYSTWITKGYKGYSASWQVINTMLYK